MTRKKKSKDKEEEVEEVQEEKSMLPPIILMDPLRSDEPKLRMINLFGDLNEEKAKQITLSLVALRATGEEEVYEDPEDIDSPVKEIIFKPIDFYISTWGGDALGMFAIYDAMRMVREDCVVNTFGMGKVMSAGVLLLASGTKGKRRIGANCRVMLHAVAGGNWGPIHNLENEMEEMRWIQEQHTNALVKETDITKKHLKKMLDRKVNVYLDAKQAVEYGIAGISTRSLELRWFKH